MDDKDIRATGDPCTLGAQTGTIIVRQVVGEKMKQKSLDIHITIPESKPAIEQIVDVFVKDVEVNSVDVIPDKVIVRGEFEIKAIYVAHLPELPVHAYQLKHYKWTLDIDLPGARKGMDADASVVVEFVDYDVDEHSRAYKHKHYDPVDDDDDYCDDDDEDEDDNTDECDDEVNDEDNCHHHHHHHHKRWTREFDVSVILKVTAKVMADREVTLNSTLPIKPKG